MRYRTAIFLSLALIGVMFGLPAAIWAVFMPSLKQGLPNPLPDYEVILLKFAIFCARYRWLVLPPVLSALSLFAALTRTPRVRDSHRAAGYSNTRRSF
jgi:hypothetical protein